MDLGRCKPGRQSQTTRGVTGSAGQLKTHPSSPHRLPIVETAKLNGLDPEAYPATVLDRLAHGHLNSQLEQLLPWNIPPKLAAAA